MRLLTDLKVNKNRINFPSGAKAVKAKFRFQTYDLSTCVITGNPEKDIMSRSKIFTQMKLISRSQYAESGCANEARLLRPTKIDYGFALLCIIVLSFSLMFLHHFKISINPAPVIFRSMLVTLLLVIAVIYSRRAPRIADIARVAFWSIIFTNIFVLPIYFGIRLHIPFHDGILVAADRYLGIEVPTIIKYCQVFPIVMKLLDYIYDSLVFLIATALILPAAFGQTDKSNKFLLAIALCVFISLPIMYFIQAIGPWVPYKEIHAINVQVHSTRIMEALKSGQPLIFDLAHVEPVVTFPSWHSILAVLSAIALLRVPVMRWLGPLWAVSVMISCVSTAWHYPVDVLAGLILAVAMAGLAGVIISRATEKPQGQTEPS